MVELKIISGKKAGTTVQARRFPFTIGRASSSDFPLEEPGVWDRHCSIERRDPGGFFLAAQPDAIVSVEPALGEEGLLRNGAILELGSVKIAFALAVVRQRSFAFREILSWIGIGLLCAGQIALIYLVLD